MKRLLNKILTRFGYTFGKVKVYQNITCLQIGFTKDYQMIIPDDVAGRYCVFDVIFDEPVNTRDIITLLSVGTTILGEGNPSIEIPSFKLRPMTERRFIEV